MSCVSQSLNFKSCKLKIVSRESFSQSTMQYDLSFLFCSITYTASHIQYHIYSIIYTVSYFLSFLFFSFPLSLPLHLLHAVDQNSSRTKIRKSEEGDGKRLAKGYDHQVQVTHTGTGTSETVMVAVTVTHWH